jgi:hypothetical protein
MLANNYSIGMDGNKRISCDQISVLSDGPATSFSTKGGSSGRVSHEANEFYNGLQQACAYREVALSFGILGL